MRIFVSRMAIVVVVSGLSAPSSFADPGCLAAVEAAAHASGPEAAYLATRCLAEEKREEAVRMSIQVKTWETLLKREEEELAALNASYFRAFWNDLVGVSSTQERVGEITRLRGELASAENQAKELEAEAVEIDRQGAELAVLHRAKSAR